MASTDTQAASAEEVQVVAFKLRRIWLQHPERSGNKGTY